MTNQQKDSITYGRVVAYVISLCFIIVALGQLQHSYENWNSVFFLVKIGIPALIYPIFTIYSHKNERIGFGVITVLSILILIIQFLTFRFLTGFMVAGAATVLWGAWRAAIKAQEVNLTILDDEFIKR